MFKNLIILIPAYNEEKNIENVIKKFKKYAEILVVDDNSADATYKIAKINAHYLIKNKRNYGYDKTLRVGIKYIIQNIKKKFIITVDGDGQHNPSAVKRFLLKIKNYDIIVGERNLLNRKIEKKISNISYKEIGIKDPLSGMKCYRTKSIKKYFGQLDKKFDYLGMFFIPWIKFLKISSINIKVNKKNKPSSMGESTTLDKKFYNQFKKLIN
jgi:glycosyltransferase involved in cell wall biosynthesis